MNPTKQLHDLGQSLWLDNIMRELLDDGTLRYYSQEFCISGLTSNPTIFDNAIAQNDAYDESIRQKSVAGRSGEALFIELALEDLRRAADIFHPIFATTAHLDGWVSMEISPLLANDTQGSIKAAWQIHQQADRSNLLVKIPGTPAGIEAIEALIFGGVPINITLLFSREHYLAAANAYMCGIERRIAEGLDPKVGSVASIFISRWDTAANDKVAAPLRNKLGIAIAGRCYSAYRELLTSPRWQKLANAGAIPQRILWASTGTKDPSVADTLYVEALAAPDTINTMPEKTLRAFGAHGVLGEPMRADGRDAELMLKRFAFAGVDIDVLATQLQLEGAQSFIKSWQQLLQRIAQKCNAIVNTY